jgi:hypothetical protein
MSLWLAFHSDLARPDSEDPVARQSTRLQAVFADDAQTTYNPRRIREIITGLAFGEGKLMKLFGIGPDDVDDPAHDAMFAEADMLAHLDATAPPVLLWYWTHDKPLTAELDARDGIHHPAFGRELKRRMNALAIPCRVHFREELDPLDGDTVVAFRDRQSVAFAARVLVAGISPDEPVPEQ